jgi:hypothetical protein
MNSAKPLGEVTTRLPALIGENISLRSRYLARAQKLIEPRAKTEEQTKPRQPPFRHPPSNILLPTSNILDLLKLDLQEILRHSPRTSRHSAYKRSLVHCGSRTSELIRDLDGSEIYVELAAREIC